MKHIPNLITSLNLTSGFIAIIFAVNGNILTASWLIALAMIFDFLDGFSARLLNAYSSIGKELDSLADIVSFGVAPGLIIYKLLETSTIAAADQVDPGLHGLVTVAIILIPAIMPVLAALRLAIFNIDTTQATTFKGLPTPANALAVISIVIAAHYSNSLILSTLTGSATALIILTLALSLLMVSRIPLFSLKINNFRLKGNEGRYLLLIMIIVSLAVLGIAAIPLVVPFYIAASFSSYLFKTDPNGSMK
jgi:CDP-diacylglycerol---serine O-phosphatidyltransferase